MGFWIFMFIMNLLIPLTMIIYGIRFQKSAPKKINHISGYRTTMSMKNENTWKYAHNYFGKIWFVCGLVLLPISLIVMILLKGKSNDTIGIIGGILCFVQFIPLAVATIPTEKALKKVFDENGNRR